MPKARKPKGEGEPRPKEEVTPFEPEAGAYGGGHHHGDESVHKGIIHEFGKRGD